jgi:uncharacterized membrane protein
MAGTALRRSPRDASIAPRTATAQAPGRIAGLDALRGLALLAMIAYHFCFDLRWFGLTAFDFERDLRWIIARSIILGTFLVVAGVSFALSAQRPDLPRRFARQVARIAAAALLVTVATYVAFPERYIWFGVLHAIAVSLVLAFPLVRRPRSAVAIGAAVVAAGVLFSHAVFDSRALGWIGFMTYKPPTEDYVPLFPWTGVLLIGVAAGHALVRTNARALEPIARLPRAVAALGRHSLLVYLVHQPLLIGLLWLVTRR